jgi:hypothetical protein
MNDLEDLCHALFVTACDFLSGDDETDRVDCPLTADELADRLRTFADSKAETITLPYRVNNGQHWKADVTMQVWADGGKWHAWVSDYKVGKE